MLPRNPPWARLTRTIVAPKLADERHALAAHPVGHEDPDRDGRARGRSPRTRCRCCRSWPRRWCRPALMAPEAYAWRSTCSAIRSLMLPVMLACSSLACTRRVPARDSAAGSRAAACCRSCATEPMKRAATPGSSEGAAGVVMAPTASKRHHATAGACRVMSSVPHRLALRGPRAVGGRMGLGHDLRTPRTRPTPVRRAASPMASATERLDGWKAIAAYLGRDIRTVQRWELKRTPPDPPPGAQAAGHGLRLRGRTRRVAGETGAARAWSPRLRRWPRRSRPATGERSRSPWLLVVALAAGRVPPWFARPSGRRTATATPETRWPIRPLPRAARCTRRGSTATPPLHLNVPCLAIPSYGSAWALLGKNVRSFVPAHVGRREGCQRARHRGLGARREPGARECARPTSPCLWPLVPGAMWTRGGLKHAGLSTSILARRRPWRCSEILTAPTCTPAIETRIPNWPSRSTGRRSTSLPTCRRPSATAPTT